MRFLPWVSGTLLAAWHHGHAAVIGTRAARDEPIAPKVMIISMFSYEANVWYANMPSSGLGDLLAVNISTPGLSMLFPHVHCLADHSVCQVTTGEAEINAAATVMALALSPQLDLSRTYILIAGIAGISPHQGTTGAVVLSRYAVQVALQYEFDAREMPANFSTGYFGFNSAGPGAYPTETYGSEVFELSAGLRDRAFALASTANLSDSADAVAYRARYTADGAGGHEFAAATADPGVLRCDTATSDVYYSGTMLSEAFENVTTLWTNGSGSYCMSAQEDNATLEVLVRMAIEGLVDFSRVILMRTASDFDRPPPGVSAYDHLIVLDQGGFVIAIDNIYKAGVEIVKGILADWNCTYEKGVEAGNYVGDILGSLGGQPDFGLGSITNGVAVQAGGKTGDLQRRGVGVGAGAGAGAGAGVDRSATATLWRRGGKRRIASRSRIVRAGRKGQRGGGA